MDTVTWWIYNSREIPWSEKLTLEQETEVLRGQREGPSTDGTSEV